MAEKMKPDKLMLDVRQADAAGLSYGISQMPGLGLLPTETVIRAYSQGKRDHPPSVRRTAASAR